MGKIYTDRDLVRVRTKDGGRNLMAGERPLRPGESVVGGFVVRDTLLDTNSLITTKMRINAEPGPPLPDLGARTTGGTGANGALLKHKEATGKFKKMVGDLTDEEREELAAEVGKYSGRAPSRVSPLGAMSNDAQSSDAHLNDDQRQRAAMDRRTEAFNAASRNFWDKQIDKRI